MSLPTKETVPGSPPSKIQLDAFLAHVVNTLPDALSLRETILCTLSWLLSEPQMEEYRVYLGGLVHSLRLHEKQQMEFAEFLNSLAAGSGSPATAGLNIQPS